MEGFMTGSSEKKSKVLDSVRKEVYCGIWPVRGKERTYGFGDAFLVLSGYCVATWSYTQGAYLARLVGFPQLLVGAFLGAILLLLVYQLPVILATRYGIDIWIWLRAVLGTRGVKVLTVVIIVINFPWYAVCCDLFAKSMRNLLSLFGVATPDWTHLALCLLCVGLGTLVAYRGVSAITWTTRLLVPILLLIGVIVVIVGFSSVPAGVIWNYKPVEPLFDHATTSYILSIEANFAFVITLVGGMAGVPRLCKTERGGFYAGVLGQGLSGSLFVVVGAVMAIAMQYVTGEMVEDPTLMMATLSIPIMGLMSLVLVAFANIGTQAVGSYLYAVMLKSTFKKADYRVLVLALAAYVSILCVWGKIVEYFGAFLTLTACIYAPLGALLLVDFFFVRKQRFDMRSAFELPGHDAYRYTNGYNIIGLFCIIVGCAISLLVYDPINMVVHNEFLFSFTPTGLSFVGSGILYLLLCKLPFVRRYMGKDAKSRPDTKPFDRNRIPPKQNLLIMPLLWLYCLAMTIPGRLTIKKTGIAVKPPFLVIGSHHSFTDFFVTPLAIFPHRANYISELEGFEWFGEWPYRQIGCLGTRKFVDDLALVRNIKRVIDRKGILVLYPEARYANVGTNSKLSLSVAKLVKFLKVPVVTINMKGNYLQSPIWNLVLRKEARLHADLTYALTKEEVRALSLWEIYEKISGLLTYDEYAYQRENKMRITYSKRAEGIHLPIYQCRDCGTQFRMSSHETKLFCEACGSEYEMDELGTLQGKNGPVYIPDWYEWQRQQVQEEILRGEYCLDMDVSVEALPNAVNFIDCGEGRLHHDANGFTLLFDDYETKSRRQLAWTCAETESIHTEYNYRNRGQCVTLSTPDNTYFLFPRGEGFNATKIQFATECLFERCDLKKKKGAGKGIKAKPVTVTYEASSVCSAPGATSATE